MIRHLATAELRDAAGRRPIVCPVRGGGGWVAPDRERELATLPLRIAGLRPRAKERCISCSGSGVVAWVEPLEDAR